MNGNQLVNNKLEYIRITEILLSLYEGSVVVNHILCMQSGCFLPGAHALQPMTSLQRLVDEQCWQAVEHR